MTGKLKSERVFVLDYRSPNLALQGQEDFQYRLCWQVKENSEYAERS